MPRRKRESTKKRQQPKQRSSEQRSLELFNQDEVQLVALLEKLLAGDLMGKEPEEAESWLDLILGAVKDFGPMLAEVIPDLLALL